MVIVLSVLLIGFRKCISGADPGFQVREVGSRLKKIRRAEGGAKMFGVFRVKNHDFTPKKIIFFPIAEGGAKYFGVFCVKNHDFTPKNHIFSNFRGVARQVHPCRGLSNEQSSTVWFHI